MREADLGLCFYIESREEKLIPTKRAANGSQKITSPDCANFSWGV